MRITRVEATNFLSYEDLDLDLSEAHMIGVVGPNGAGKSSLLDAILYALYGGGRAPADELIHDDAEQALVAVTFMDGLGREVRVQRERSRRSARGESTLTLQIDGEVQTGHTIAETQVQIEKIIGLTLDALLAGPIMVQNGSDELMRLTASQRKELLVRLFDLDRFEAYEKRAKEWWFDADTKRQAASMRIDGLTEEIDQELDIRRQAKSLATAIKDIEGLMEPLAEEIIGLHEEAAVLLERSKRNDVLDAELDMANKRINGAQSEIDRMDLPEQPLLPPTNSIASMEERLAAKPDVRSRVAALTEQRGTLATQWKSAKRDSAILATVPCQHLERQVDRVACASCQFLQNAVEARDTLGITEQAGARVAQQVADLEKDVVYVDTLTRELAEAKDQKHAYQIDQERRHRAGALQEQITTDNAKVTTLNAERLRLAQDVERRTSIAKELGEKAVVLEQMKLDVAQATPALAEANATLRHIAKAKDEKEGLQTALTELEVRVDRLRLLARAFHRDGIPTLILENGIPLIEQRANEVLARMPGSWSVQLRTQRDLKTGGVRETLDILLTTGGAERPYGLLSGGERFRVDFALRMALAAVLARRGGSPAETLWLDEGWGSQDREGRDALLESLAAVSDEFPLTVVVSHVPEVTDRMPQRLEVSKVDGSSRAELIA